MLKYDCLYKPLVLPMLTKNKCNGNSRKRIIVSLIMRIDYRKTIAIETITFKIR